MFGIGMTELLVILVVALIVFGPARLPELARSLGRAMHEFRRASNDLRASFNEAVEPTPPPDARKATPPVIAPPSAPAPIDQPRTDAGGAPATAPAAAAKDEPAAAQPASDAGPAEPKPASSANG
jgi:TatA/E family protein of Tat protein translocase